jgi:hypothetical protein
VSEQDRNTIIQVINLYGLAIDARRWDLFDQVFTADVDACYDNSRHWHDLAAFKADFAASHEPYYHTQHAMLNHLVTVTGDAAQAFTYISWRLVMRNTDGDDIRDGSAWYDDEFVRLNGSWLIKRRTSRVTWWQRTLLPAATVTAMASELPIKQVREVAAAGSVTFLNPRASTRTLNMPEPLRRDP